MQSIIKIVGFIELIGILALASCVEGSRDDGADLGVSQAGLVRDIAPESREVLQDGDLGVRQAVVAQVTCYGKCNNGEIVSGWSNEWGTMAEAIANAKGQVQGYCGHRGGLREHIRCE